MFPDEGTVMCLASLVELRGQTFSRKEVKLAFGNSSARQHSVPIEISLNVQ